VSCSNDNVNLVHEIATILVEGFVRLRAQECSPPDRLNSEQKVTTAAQNQLEPPGVQSDGSLPKSIRRSSATGGADAEH